MSNQDLNIEDLELNAPDADDIDAEVPEDPGPALMGKTPVIGTVRRNNNLPVLRDELKDQL